MFSLNPDLNGIVDFIICDNSTKKTGNTDDNGELNDWAMLSVHRCLVYLGDLCRYRLDIYPNWDSNLAIRYYSQALSFKPEYGMPHNQMGTLANNNNNPLDSTYFYLRSLDCKHTFEGTENNLHRLFEKNSHYLEQLPVETDADCIVQPEPGEHIKRFLARFLLLVDVWWFNKKIPQIYDLCHQTNVDLQECMAYLKPVTNGSIDNTTDVDTIDTDSTNSIAYLTHDMIFKIVSICLICVQKLQKDHSQHVSNVIPFTLAVYSQLVQTVIGHIQEGILNFPLPPVENNIDKWLNSANNKPKIKKRRRRKVQHNSDEDSSENESVCAFNESDEEIITSDVELDPSSTSDEEEADANSKKSEEKVVNGISDDKSDKSSQDDSKITEEILKKCKRIDVNDMLAIFADEPLLQCIKILNDWLRGDPDVLRTCVKSTKTLFNQIINLVNLLYVKVDDGKLKDLRVEILKDNMRKIALPEDVMLKGVQILTYSQKEINWIYSSKLNLCTKEQSVLRMLKVLSFGDFLTTINGTGISHNKEEGLFIIKLDEPYINGIDEPVSFFFFNNFIIKVFVIFYVLCISILPSHISSVLNNSYK